MQPAMDWKYLEKSPICTEHVQTLLPLLTEQYSVNSIAVTLYEESKQSTDFRTWKMCSF
jgi:hypothetical protein